VSTGCRGSERIRGELLKLGIHVAKRTIQHSLHLERSGRPAGQHWATCLKTHASDIWSCDFVPVIDRLFRQLYVCFIVELESRRVVHFGVTRHPSQFWAAQQLREATPNGQGPRFVLRDNDTKYGVVSCRNTRTNSGCPFIRDNALSWPMRRICPSARTITLT
jgi:hypothetical protein